MNNTRSSIHLFLKDGEISHQVRFKRLSILAKKRGLTFAKKTVDNFWDRAAAIQAATAGW
jgi:hypothetical protein